MQACDIRYAKASHEHVPMREQDGLLWPGRSAGIQYQTGVVRPARRPALERCGLQESARLAAVHSLQPVEAQAARRAFTAVHDQLGRNVEPLTNSLPFSLLLTIPTIPSSSLSLSFPSSSSQHRMMGVSSKPGPPC